MRKNEKKLLKVTQKGPQIHSKTDGTLKYLLFNLKLLKTAKKVKCDGRTDRRTDGRTDGRTDRPTNGPTVTYRVACTRLKILYLIANHF